MLSWTRATGHGTANLPLRVHAAQNGNDPRDCGGRFVSFREEPDAYLVSGAAGAFFIAAFFAAAFFTIAR